MNFNVENFAGVTGAIRGATSGAVNGASAGFIQGAGGVLNG